MRIVQRGEYLKYVKQHAKACMIAPVEGHDVYVLQNIDKTTHKLMAYALYRRSLAHTKCAITYAVR